jgi:hypothetical protein
MAPAGCPVSDGGPMSALGAIHLNVRLALVGAFIRNDGRLALSVHGWRETALRLHGSTGAVDRSARGRCGQAMRRHGRWV